MKKFFTLAIIALFTCLNMMAQDFSLGAPKFNLSENCKVKPSTFGAVTMTLPEMQNCPEGAMIDAVGVIVPKNLETYTEEDSIWVEFIGGVDEELQSLVELAPSTSYEFRLYSVMINDGEVYSYDNFDEPIALINFRTKTDERKLAWEFLNTTEDINAIKASIEAGQQVWTASSKGRFATARAYKYEEVLIDSTSMLPLPMLEDLTFNCAGGQMIVGNPDDTPANNRLQLNGKRSFIIPDCKKGDEISFTAVYATKKSDCYIKIKDDPESPCELDKDSINTGSSKSVYKFVLEKDGDLEVFVNNVALYAINIFPGDKEKAQFKYSINAVDAEGNVVKAIKPETEGTEGDGIKVTYSYWLTTADNKLISCGAAGTPFENEFELNSDTVFTLKYKSTGIENVVYCAEAETLEGAIECTSANMAVRSSNKKAAHFEADTKLCTLQPGSYKIRVVLFDANKTANLNAVIKLGEESTAEDSIYFNASKTNFDEIESQLITVTEPTNVYVTPFGGDQQGIDCIAIYEATEEPVDPEDPDAVEAVAADAKAAVAVKAIVDGKIVVVKNGAVYNVVGAQMK